MRLFFLLSGIFLFASCGVQVDGYDSLNEAEKRYIIELGFQECLGESQTNFENYKVLSAELLNSLTVTDSFIYSKKLDTTLTETQTITVWKKTATDIYFLNTKLDVINVIKTYRFIKYPLATDVLIIEDMQFKKCDISDSMTMDQNDDSGVITNSTSVSINGGSIATLSTYTVDFSLPAYFSTFVETATRQTFNTAGSVTETKTITGSLSDKTSEVLLPLYTDYNDGTNPTQYCVIEQSASTPTIQYSFPYDLDCTTSDSVGPSGFSVPSSEL